MNCYFSLPLWNTVKYQYRFLVLMLAAFLAIPATGLAQDRDLSITVYTNGLGLIQEVRPTELAKGRSVVTLPSVATQIDPTSVRVRSLTAPDRVSILEQRYTYDLLNADAVLGRYVDREIALYVTGSETPIRGRLLSLGTEVILACEDSSIDIIRRDAIQRYNVAKRPEGLVTAPTLTWVVDNKGNTGPHRIEVSYLTEGMSWHVEYTAVVHPKEKDVMLSAWASIDNRSGAWFDNAALTLVAGDVNRVQQERPVRYRAMAMAAEAGADRQFNEQQIFEYHTYTLDRRATLENNGTAQLAMLPDTRVKVKKYYVYDGAQMPASVLTRLRLENRKQVGLGIPLPRGKVRMYQEQENGQRLFIGEDALNDLAKDEAAYLTVGRAFDIAGERTQAATRQLSKQSREESFQIVLRNHTADAVTVKVVEHLNNAPNWFIRQSSQPYEKVDARTIEFDVSVPKDGETTVTYTVVYRW